MVYQHPNRTEEGREAPREPSPRGSGTHAIQNLLDLSQRLIILAFLFQHLKTTLHQNLDIAQLKKIINERSSIHGKGSES